jgi:glucan 1,3-beta-glucosidase
MSALGAGYTAPVGADSRTVSEDEEEGKEWIASDPQGRAAARIAERRDKEGGAGFVPVSVGAGGAAFGAGQGKRRGWKRWWVLALGVLAIVALAVGLGVGLTAGRKNGGTGNLAAQKSGTTNGTTTNGTTTDASGNSTSFTKDLRLHNSFHAFAYTPQNVLVPA